MNLFTHAGDRFPGFSGRKAGRCCKDLVLVLSGVFLAVVISLIVSDYFSGGQGVVYAGGEDYGPGGRELQAGLMGVIGGVAGMEDYYRAGQTKNAVNANEEILVGTKTVSRNAVNRNAFGEEIQKAGALGYSALQTVAQHQLPYDEYYTLLQIVEAEATGGDVLSKLLVANVILNRVEDSHFPDTISEVVWEKVDGYAQFSPTEDGRIYSCAITESTIEAVDRALQGEDNSQGALFFVARESASEQNVQWFDSSLVWLFEYGGHEYYTFREYCE